MRLDYFHFGDRGKPLVFLHGWQQDKKSFSSLVPYLFKTNRSYLLDLPGFGKSEFPQNNFTSYSYADEIAKWIENHKLKGIILVGHSFGGKIATIIANKYPEFVDKLILIANSGIPERRPNYFILKLIPNFIKKQLAFLFTSNDYKNAGKLLPVFKNIVKENLTDEFSQIKKPTLIIWGKNDKELPIEMGKKINNLIKNSILKIVPTGHFPFIDKPQEIAELIKDFIGGSRSR